MGVLKRIFGGSRLEQPQPALLLFLLLPTTDKVEADAIRAKLGSGVEVEADSEGRTISFSFGGAAVMAGHMPAPIPGSEVAQCAATSRLWKQSPEATAHASHLILLATGELPLLEQARICALVATAISEAIPVVGWYSGNSEQVIEPQVGIELAREEAAQLMLWVSVVISQDDATHWSLSTIGMSSFGHSEFEVVKTTQDPTDCLWRIYDIAQYVLENGPILKHGQTFGESSTEQNRIELGRSKLGKRGTVIRLVFP